MRHVDIVASVHRGSRRVDTKRRVSSQYLTNDFLSVITRLDYIRQTTAFNNQLLLPAQVKVPDSS